MARSTRRQPSPDLFRSAWFIESMATQILVIFVIRTRGALWCSRPNPVLVATSLAALALACIIALTPLGRAFSFVAVPALPLLTIGGIVLAYLCLAEAVKRRALREPADRPQIR